MVKKILILSMFLFMFSLNVNAQVLGTPLTRVDYVDGTSQQANATIGTWWDTQYYVSPFRIGYFTSAAAEANKISFYWGGANLCSGQNLKISGQIGGLSNFFSDNSYSFDFLNNNQNMTCAIEYQNESRVGFTCVGAGGGDLYIGLNQYSFTSRNNYEIGVRRDFDLSCEVTNLQVMQQDIINTQNIINSQNSNTQNIINNQNQNTQDIIDAHNQNAQDIIDNQNSNTDKEIDSQKVCTTEIIDSSKIILSNSALNNSGQVASNDNFSVTDFIYIKNAINFKNTLSISSSSNVYLCFYNDNKQHLSCLSKSSYNNNDNIPIPTNASYARFTLNSSTDRPQFSFDICKNGNQAVSDDLNNLNDTLNDTSQPNTNQDIDDMNDMVASDTPISDLITMPLTLINAYINGINSSCSPYNLGNLYGTDLILPCINLEQRLGSNMWRVIDALFCLFMCYNIGMLFVTAFDGITSLRDDFEGLYQPRHADVGYQPKHGGGS